MFCADDTKKNRRLAQHGTDYYHKERINQSFRESFETREFSGFLSILKSAAFGSSVFLVAFDIIPPLSITSLVVTM